MPRRSYYSSSSSSPLSTPSLPFGSSAATSPTRPLPRQNPAFPFPGVRHVGPGPEQDRLRQQFRSRGRNRGRQPPRRRAPHHAPSRPIRHPRAIGDDHDIGSDSQSDDAEAAEFRRGRGRWRGMTGGTGMWDSNGRPMGRGGGDERQRAGTHECGRRRRGTGDGGRGGGHVRVTGGGRSRGNGFAGLNMGVGGFRAASRGPRMRAAPLHGVRARERGSEWTSGFARRRGGGGGGGRMAFAGSCDSSSSSEWSDCTSPGYASPDEERLGPWGKSWDLPKARPRDVQEAYYDSPYVVGSRRATGRGGYAYGFEGRRPRMRGFAIAEDEGWLRSLWGDWFGGGRSAAIMPWTRWWG